MDGFPNDFYNKSLPMFAGNNRLYGWEVDKGMWSSRQITENLAEPEEDEDDDYVCAFCLGAIYGCECGCGGDVEDVKQESENCVKCREYLQDVKES